MFTHNIDFNNLQVINFTEDISHQCAAGVAYETPCYKGLAYNPEIHVCDYPDSVRCLRCFQTLLFFHLSRAPEEPFSLQDSASRCRTVRNNLRGSLGSNALRWLWYCFFFFWPNCLLFLNVLVENILLLCISHHYLTGPRASPQCCRQALPPLPKVTWNVTKATNHHHHWCLFAWRESSSSLVPVCTIHCRFPMPGDDSAYIVCVADNPRIHYCGDNSLFDPQTLSCLNYEVTS